MTSKINLKFAIFFISIFITLIFITNVNSLNLEQFNVSFENLSKESQNYLNNLDDSYVTLDKMNNAGLNVQQYNDTLYYLEDMIYVRIDKELLNKSTDYSIVASEFKKLKDLEQDAFATLDELNALKAEIELEEELNVSAVEYFYYQAEKELKDGRYDEALDKIEKGYDKLSEIRSTASKVKAFYLATSRNIKTFFKNNWQIIAGIIISSIIIYTLTKKRINRYITKQKIRKLKLRRKIIKELVAKAQRDYFEKGIIGEKTYHIRAKKYSELVRDINRQIPVLREELMLGRKVKHKKRGK